MYAEKIISSLESLGLCKKTGDLNKMYFEQMYPPWAA